MWVKEGGRGCGVEGIERRKEEGQMKKVLRPEVPVLLVYDVRVQSLQSSQSSRWYVKYIMKSRVRSTTIENR